MPRPDQSSRRRHAAHRRHAARSRHTRRQGRRPARQGQGRPQGHKAAAKAKPAATTTTKAAKATAAEQHDSSEEHDSSKDDAKDDDDQDDDREDDLFLTTAERASKYGCSIDWKFYDSNAPQLPPPALPFTPDNAINRTFILPRDYPPYASYLAKEKQGFLGWMGTAA